MISHREVFSAADKSMAPEAIEATKERTVRVEIPNRKPSILNKFRCGHRSITRKTKAPIEVIL